MIPYCLCSFVIFRQHIFEYLTTSSPSLWLWVYWMQLTILVCQVSFFGWRFDSSSLCEGFNSGICSTPLRKHTLEITSMWIVYCKNNIWKCTIQITSMWTAYCKKYMKMYHPDNKYVNSLLFGCTVFKIYFVTYPFLGVV